jgi:hypothetical protein
VRGKQRRRLALAAGGGLLALLLAHGMANPGNRALAGSPRPILQLGFGASEIWSPSDSAVSALHQCQGAHLSCVQPIMQQAGAGPDAIAFFQLTGWFLSDITGSGPVQLGTIFDPWLANENSQPALLGGTPAVVLPNDHVSDDPVKRDPAYTDLLAAHPNLTFWGFGPRTGTTGQSADGGQEFVFDYRLLDGCHACAVLGYARFAFDFAPDGTFESARFLSLTPTSGG